ncbi:MAG TPA: pentapeptide repeat-containing protein [Baekduia sp.]|nr:pentapeptide repeat-containing protein [Baekduia sp.]
MVTALPTASAEHTPAADAERLDVVPLLKAYSDALRLARRPPASLALPHRLERVHRQLRPTFGCHYFTTRHVRRRTAALERALARRTAIGEADADDAVELESLRTFRSSLSPPPSRGWTAAGLLAAILLSQAIVGWLLNQASEGDSHSQLFTAFRNVSLSLDVRSIRSLGDSLVAADYVELGCVMTGLMLLIYLFGRPLTSGYRIAAMATGRWGRAGRIRRTSPLARCAAALDVNGRERTASRITDAELRQEPPLDVLVLAAPWLVVTFGLVGATRLDDLRHPFLHVAGCALAAGALLALGWRNGPRTWRLSVVAGAAAIAGAVMVWLTHWNPIVDTILALTVTRLAWLVHRAHRRGYSPLWVGVPLAMVATIASIAPLQLYGVNDDGGLDPSVERQWAFTLAGLDDLPQVDRADLQVLLSSHRRLAGADLRAQDLHGLSATGKELAGAQLTLADLRLTDLSNSDLRHADLVGALAFHALLRHADLRGADLKCAQLEGADLRGARLDGTRLRNAVADRTTRWPRGFHQRHAGVITHAEAVEAAGGYTTFYGYYYFGCRLGH